MFCFFKQKTAYEMRISDWSSDVCSSDLIGVGAERLRRRFDRRLIARRERAQRMLDAVAKLPRHLVGNVDRVLGDEIDADALRSDQPHDLLDLVEQRAGRIVEQQVRLVEEIGRASCRERVCQYV